MPSQYGTYFNHDPDAADDDQDVLNETHSVQYIQTDLLDFVQTHSDAVDTLVSAYALHHLTPAEKKQFFQALCSLLKPGGQALMGDLMFKNKAGKAQMYQRYPKLVPDFDDEFFGDLENCSAELIHLGFTLTTIQFSDLSWGIQALK